MSQRIFRPSVIDRLDSPERLDELIQVIRPRAWIVLGVLALGLVAAAAWLFFGRVPLVTTADAVSLNHVNGTVLFRIEHSEPIPRGAKVKLVAREASLPPFFGSMISNSVAQIDLPADLHQIPMPGIRYRAFITLREVAPREWLK